MLRKLLEGYDILRYFDSALFSDETIIRKPDAGIFERSLRELGADQTANGSCGGQLGERYFGGAGGRDQGGLDLPGKPRIRLIARQ